MFSFHIFTHLTNPIRGLVWWRALDCVIDPLHLLRGIFFWHIPYFACPRMTMLTPAMKEGLRKHKYACVDSSPYSQAVMHPFWNYVVQVSYLNVFTSQFCPKWVAPNALTLGGFLFTVLDFIVIWYYDPHLESTSNIPRWVWLFSAFCVFAANTLGKLQLF